MGWLKDRREFRQLLEETASEEVVAQARQAWAVAETDATARRDYRGALFPHFASGHQWKVMELLGAAFQAYEVSFKEEYGAAIPKRFIAEGDLDPLFAFDDVHAMLHKKDPAWVKGGRKFRDSYALVAAGIFMHTSPYAKRFTLTPEAAKEVLARLAADFGSSAELETQGSRGA